MISRTVAGALTLIALGILGFWISTWQPDEALFTKILGAGTGYETLAPAWPGAGQLTPTDLSAAARRSITASSLAEASVWADACTLFDTVPDLAANRGRLNNRVLPPLPQGDGTFRSHEVVLVREWNGWKLAKIRCGPVSQIGGKLINN